MTLSEYQQIYGTAGLIRLAERAETQLSYIRQLICTAGKRPSAAMALRLIRASDGQITLEGLANPVGQVGKAKPLTNCGLTAEMALRIIQASGRRKLTLEEIVDATTPRREQATV